MATKDYYPTNTEREVLEVSYICADCNYKVRVAPRTETGVTNLRKVKEVRTSYKPHIGQLIKLSRQDA